MKTEDLIVKIWSLNRDLGIRRLQFLSRLRNLGNFTDY